MSIVTLVLAIVIFGFLCWLVQTIPAPITSWTRTVIIGILFIAFLIWVLNSMGVNTGFNVKLK
jgi:hypothetical protein